MAWNVAREVKAEARNRLAAVKFLKGIVSRM